MMGEDLAMKLGFRVYFRRRIADSQEGTCEALFRMLDSPPEFWTMLDPRLKDFVVEGLGLYAT